MKSGFTLIELVVAISIGSILSLVLYRSLSDATTVSLRITSITDTDNQIALLYNQIDKDISTAFLPEQIFQTELKQTETPKTDQKTTTTGQEMKQFKIEKPFYAEIENENLKVISIINTNPLRGFDEVVPLIVQVAYRLVQDKESPGSFKLYRQQTSKIGTEIIDDKDMKKFRGYEIVTGLKSFKSQFIFKNLKEGETTPEAVKLKEWKSDAILQKYKRQLPEFLELEGEIQDEAKKRTRQFKFVIPILAKYQEQKIEKKPSLFSTLMTGTPK
ncbi:prepilin-type N-terminal cleavage/methylation domain-containing protein [Candidatus Dependentiae bacterium]|nr:prepilin-type N-terminal cleavage/methylation domain-containing protein [Candidatus Dependentiae bacterium]